MKKTSRTPPSSRQTDSSDLIDLGLDCCVNIETLAELLKSCKHAETLERNVIANTAHLVLEENKKLRDVLNRFHSQLQNSNEIDS